MALVSDPETVPQFRVTAVMVAAPSVTVACTSTVWPGSGEAGTVAITPSTGPCETTGLCTPGVASVARSTAVDVHWARLNERLGAVTSGLRTMVLFSKFVDGTTRLSTTTAAAFLSFAPSLTLPFQVARLADQASAGKSTGKLVIVVRSPATRASPGAMDPERFQVKMSTPLPTAINCQPVRSTATGPEL